MVHALEAAKRMLQEVPALLLSVKEQQQASEAAATVATAEAVQAKNALEDAQAKVLPTAQILWGWGVGFRHTSPTRFGRQAVRTDWSLHHNDNKFCPAKHCPRPTV